MKSLLYSEQQEMEFHLEVESSVDEGIDARVENSGEKQGVLDLRRDALHTLGVENVPQRDDQVGRPAPHECQHVHRAHSERHGLGARELERPFAPPQGTGRGRVAQGRQGHQRLGRRRVMRQLHVCCDWLVPLSPALVVATVVVLAVAVTVVVLLSAFPVDLGNDVGVGNDNDREGNHVDEDEKDAVVDFLRRLWPHVKQQGRDLGVVFHQFLASKKSSRANFGKAIATA